MIVTPLSYRNCCAWKSSTDMSLIAFSASCSITTSPWAAACARMLCARRTCVLSSPANCRLFASLATTMYVLASEIWSMSCLENERALSISSVMLSASEMPSR
uniref:Uncharacterized protein n=1 Tax=Arundo donax TaxID=35708 RepID=A0A0A9EZH1_ARUDO